MGQLPKLSYGLKATGVLDSYVHIIIINTKEKWMCKEKNNEITFKKYIKKILKRQKVKNFKKLGALWILQQFSVWADAFYFCFICLQWSYTVFDVISPINVSGKLTLEHVSLSEDFTCYISTCLYCFTLNMFMLQYSPLEACSITLATPKWMHRNACR